MENNRGCGGVLNGLFADPTLLFFIIIFLLLFWGCTGPACNDC